MSWPEYVWRPQDPNADDMGMVPFSPPANAQVTYGVDEGLPDDWQDYDGTVDRVNAWDVLSNPLYEAAAGALDIDWEEFKNNFNETIGEQDLYERPEAEDAPAGGTQAEIDRVSNAADGDDDEPYDWGITDEGIERDLNSMQGWLQETIGAADEQQGYSGSGPSADQYANIDGDIWAHFGLDKPPEKPKPLGDEYFAYKDSPSNYDKLERYGGDIGGYDNPWIQAGQWLGDNPNYAERFPFRGEKGATHVDWEYQRASGALTAPPAKGAGPAHDFYLADRERNMPGNDLNPDVPGSGGNKLGQGAWGDYGTTPPGTETTTTEA